MPPRLHPVSTPSPSRFHPVFTQSLSRLHPVSIPSSPRLYHQYYEEIYYSAVTYRITSNRRPGRLLNFRPLRGEVYSRGSLKDGGVY